MLTTETAAAWTDLFTAGMTMATMAPVIAALAATTVVAVIPAICRALHPNH